MYKLIEDGYLFGRPLPSVQDRNRKQEPSTRANHNPTGGQVSTGPTKRLAAYDFQGHNGRKPG